MFQMNTYRDEPRFVNRGLAVHLREARPGSFLGYVRHGRHSGHHVKYTRIRKHVATREEISLFTAKTRDLLPWMDTHLVVTRRGDLPLMKCKGDRGEIQPIGHGYTIGNAYVDPALHAHRCRFLPSSARRCGTRAEDLALVEARPIAETERYLRTA